MKIIFGLVAALAVGAVSIKPALHFFTKETVTVQVTDKERIVSGSESKYLIFTTNETFENTDSLLAFKFNSSDVYGKLPIGKTCEMTVNGIRLPFMSMYRNILKVGECS